MKHYFEYKTESEWEAFLRKTDAFDHDYIRLLDDYAELPAGEEMILSKLKTLHGEDFIHALYGDDEDDGYEELDEYEERDNDTVSFHLQTFMDKAGSYALGSPLNPNHPCIKRYRDLVGGMSRFVLGWCNVYSCILPPSARPMGFRGLYLANQILVNLRHSGEELLQNEGKPAVVFTKRALHLLLYMKRIIAYLQKHYGNLGEFMGHFDKELSHYQTQMTAHIHDIRKLNFPVLPF